LRQKQVANDQTKPFTKLQALWQKPVSNQPADELRQWCVLYVCSTRGTQGISPWVFH